MAAALFSLPPAKIRQCNRLRGKNPAFLTLYGFCLIFIFTLLSKDFSSILHMLIHFTPFPNIITSYFLKIALPKQEQKFLRQIYYSSKLILFFWLTLWNQNKRNYLGDLQPSVKFDWNHPKALDIFRERQSPEKSQTLKTCTTLPLKTKTPLKSPLTNQSKPVLP